MTAVISQHDSDYDALVQHPENRVGETVDCIGCGLPVVIEADEAAECWRCAEEARCYLCEELHPLPHDGSCLL